MVDLGTFVLIVFALLPWISLGCNGSKEAECGGCDVGMRGGNTAAGWDVTGLFCWLVVVDVAVVPGN